MKTKHAEIIEDRAKRLVKIVEDLFPDFVHACQKKDARAIIIHQDAFAADYQNNEYILLGMAIKYAGMHSKEIRIMGTNRETLKPKVELK